MKIIFFLYKKTKIIFRDPSHQLSVALFNIIFVVYLKIIMILNIKNPINKRIEQKNHIFYLIRISSIVKLSKFDFEVRFIKNQKKYKNSILGSIEPNREKHQNNAKFGYGDGRTFSCFIRYGSGREKSSRVSLY